MGMFDYVKLSRVKLAEVLTPEQLESFPEEEDFQTKSMDNGLNCYTIEDDGTLLVQLFDPGYGDRAGLGRKKPSKYTGCMNFYTFFDLGEELYWLELTGCFISGVLDTLVLDEWKPIKQANWNN